MNIGDHFVRLSILDGSFAFLIHFILVIRRPVETVPDALVVRAYRMATLIDSVFVENEALFQTDRDGLVLKPF